MCNKCNSKGSNWGDTIDMNVIYTGCGGKIGDVDITPDMTLRQVLDILISNFSEPKPGTQWYIGDDVPTFPANDGDLYLRSDGHVWEYDSVLGWQETDIVLGGGGTGGGTWGSITGDINDQLDLIELISTSIENYVEGIAGTGLSYNTVSKKIDLGKSYQDLPGFVQVPFTSDSTAVIFGFGDINEDIDQNKPSIFLLSEGVQINNPIGGIIRGISLTTSSARLEFGNNSIEVSGSNVKTTSNALQLETTTGSLSISGGSASLSSTVVSLTGGTNINFLIGTSTQININATYIQPKKDMYFDIIGTSVIIRSPNGNKYKITVSDGGALTTTLVP